MIPSTTSTSSEQAPSSVPREPKSSSSSQVEASRGGNPPNSDDEDEDEDEDDVRLTRPRPHLRFSPEVGHDHDHEHRDPNRDGPSSAAAAASSSSSSAPKVVDNGAVPAEVAAGVLPVPFRLSLVLRNTGSVARDHLASERTFLAYVRTSLSFASAGVALVQLFRVSVSTSANGSSSASAVTASYARPLGATLVGFGLSVLLVGTQRYFIIQRALPLGLFPAARISVLLQAVSLAVLVGIVFGILVAVR